MYIMDNLTYKYHYSSHNHLDTFINSIFKGENQILKDHLDISPNIYYSLYPQNKLYFNNDLHNYFPLKNMTENM